MEKQKCPEIRFKEFDLNWKKNILGDITTFINGRAYSQEELLKKGKYPVLRVGNFNTNSHWYYSDLELGEKYYAEDGDLLYTWSTIFSPYIWKGEKVIYHYHIWKVELSKKLDKLFTFHFLKADEISLTNNTNGSTMIHVTKGEMEGKIIHIPVLTEQIQIGKFFQNLDQSIALHEKKLSQTQNLKKAMLEKMFPKEGSKQPEIRLRGFNGDWDSCSIFSLAQNQQLNNGVFNDQNKVGKGYKLINVLDMYIETSIDEKKLTLLDLDRKEFEQNKVKYGDVFFTRSSLVKEGIAFSNVYLGQSNDITYDGHLIKLSPNLELIDPIFLNFCLKSSKVRTQLILGGKSTTMTTIGQQEVGETIVELPSIGEQLKIGQFFKQIEETLALQQQQLQALKNLKQAFLEKMFV
ncbi:restriction endonuclease subunit S [Acinetobacter beijerinckii]|uniref:restriction endonuclease subunit S n=1 Tax=Acinetobacter TaxID=469 RepID=UPI0020C94112|nr:restriction endonuclease subunit S [Acinetobacter sp. Z1]UTO19765.1 restriction endonuclease subunit S [Acinetobacter sp. Z1]